MHIFNIKLQNIIENESTDIKNRRSFMTKYIYLLGSVTVFIFCIINFFQESYLMAYFDLILFFLLIFGLYLIKKDYDINKLGTYIVLISFFGLIFVLLIRNAVEYTLIWSFMFTFIAMVLKGTKKGLYYSLVFYSINFIIAYDFIGDHLTTASYIRFVSLSLIFICIAFLYEYSTQNTLSKLNKSLYETEELNRNLKANVKKEVEKNIEKELLIFEQSKLASMGEMIGNIAHQWRQPLSVISTGATGIKLQKEYDTLTNEILYETCDDINNNAQYLSQTIEDFKNYIKGDNNKKLFSLSDDIDSFLILVKGTIKLHNINIILDYENNININGYANELIQCFINIFNNSKDALNDSKVDKKYFFIKVYKKDDMAIIEFKDNAGGIDPKIIGNIFEPYFTTKYKSKGTGLGLYMTYNLIVESMNGYIAVKNISYDFDSKNYTGAEFVIKLAI